ncbi:uncharacterized protein [Apostichopus japonicus]|uniref:uncharacterized protein n=1 Tax=Stichopus japonicus TaxID=307972 RepID=UPI003AB529E8
MASASSKDQPTRIFLWIIARTNSTVFTKCMTFVEGVQVWYEPYLSCALNETMWNPEFKKGDPVADKFRQTLKENEASDKMKEIRADMKPKVESSSFINYQEKFKYPWVKEQLELPEPSKDFVFIKDHSFAIVDHMEALPDVPTRHTFIIRHPRQVYTSLKNVMATRMHFDGIGWEQCHLGQEAVFAPAKDLFKLHHRLWKYVKEKYETDPIVIDGQDLLSQPEVILPKYFQRLGIPFKESYLSWEASPDKPAKCWKGSADFVLLEAQTGVTSRAVQSTQFTPPKVPRGTPSRPEWTITPELKEYTEDAMPFYEEMYKHRIKP